MKALLKIFALILVFVIVVACSLAVYLFYQIDDERLSKNTQAFLSEVLGTKVELKAAKLHLLDNSIALYGFNVKDLKDVDMLHVDTLEANINFWKLLHNEIIVRGFNLSGAKAVMYQERKDTATNYQFVIDALSFVGNNEKDDKKENAKKKLYVDLRKIEISNTSVTWDVHKADTLNTKEHKQLDPNHLWVYNLSMQLSLKGGGAPGAFVGKLKHLSVDERNSNTVIAIDDVDFDGKKRILELGKADFRYQDKHLKVHGIALTGSTVGKLDSHHLVINEIDYENGIGIPKKKRGPQKGAFDAKHMKLKLALDATATCLTADSIALHIDKLSGSDINSGLSIDNATMSMTRNIDKCVLKNVNILSRRNRVKVSHVDINLPRYGDHARPWSFTTSAVSCEAMLCDISHAFAPVLRDFTTPIYATTTLSGNADNVNLNNIAIKTSDNRLRISANGIFNLPKKKGEKVSMTFNINSMHARNGVKEQILSHFNIKPKTLEFIRNFGDVSYCGTVAIPWHRQIIQGVLTTRYGAFNADVTLNNDTYYLSGKISTQDFDLGRYIENSNIGPVSLTADVTMDISSKRKANIIHRRKGKIPAGTIRGRAIEASYKGIKIKDVDFSIVSDAQKAVGQLSVTGKVMDASCDFSFDDADIKRSLKVKPHIKMHNIFSSLQPKKLIDKIFKKKKDKGK